MCKQTAVLLGFTALTCCGMHVALTDRSPLTVIAECLVSFSKCCDSASQVDYYGASTPLKALAGISAPESTMLVVQPYDKTAMQAIEKAIMQSDIGATPNSDGNLIRINIPALTAVSCQPSTSLA